MLLTERIRRSKRHLRIAELRGISRGTETDVCISALWVNDKQCLYVCSCRFIDKWTDIDRCVGFMD